MLEMPMYDINCMLLLPNNKIAIGCSHKCNIYKIIYNKKG